jgi:microcompartment protein CcmK/EutM
VIRELQAQRPEDEGWQHAAQTATIDEVAGVPHIVLLTSGAKAADFFVSYFAAVDAAIAAANAAPDSGTS